MDSKTKPHDHFNWPRKDLSQNPTSLYTKVRENLGRDGESVLQPNKAVCDKTIVNIILNREKLSFN